MDAIIKFKPETLSQKGTAGKILTWIQDNEKFTKHTNMTLMANCIAKSTDVEFYNAKMLINRMIQTQMINRFGGRKRANFYINYYHKDIPGYILEKAPDDIKSRLAEIREGLKENQHLSAEGCIVTEAPKKENEDENTITAEENLPELTEEPNEEMSKVSSDASEENTTSVPVEIRETKDGLSISITLNININK